MRHAYWMLILAIVPIGTIGCSKSGDNPSSGTAPQSASVDSAQPAAPQGEAPAGNELSGPAAAVHTFLDAVRTGNDRKADAMLTQLARKKTAEMNMVVAPPGSDTARFEVGTVEYLPEDRASVACTWTDRDDDGQPRTDQITWVLRNEPEGWRIGGMIVVASPDVAPRFLNFEDPEDMVRQQQALQDEMQRRSEQAVSQAQRPQPPQEGEAPVLR